MKGLAIATLGCGAGAVACIALAVHLRKRRLHHHLVSQAEHGRWREEASERDRAGTVSETNAYVNNWENAANAMWRSTGQRGTFTYGGDNPTAVIYAEDPDENHIPDHFTNSNGDGTYYDPSAGTVGIVGDTILQREGLGARRTLTYNPEEERE